MNKMCDSIKDGKKSFFSELEGAESISINRSWTRRFIGPWGLLFPLEGIGEISLGSSAVTVEKGSLFVYKPGVRYTFRSCGTWRYIWFHFPVRDHMLGQMSFEEILPGLGVCTPKQDIWTRIYLELSEAASLEKLHRPGWEALALLLVETVIQRFISMGQSAAIRRTHDRIRCAVRLLTGEKTYKIGDIAIECGISAPLLFQIFREEMGCSPREYREQFFLRQGKKMLLNTDFSLDDIAEKCHMCDRYYFSNRFKRLFGISPAAFRKVTCR